MSHTATVVVRSGKPTDIDSYSTTHRTAKYLFQAVDDHGEVESCEALIVQTKGQAWLSVSNLIYSTVGLGGLAVRAQNGQIFVSYHPQTSRTVEVSFIRDVL